MTADSSEIELRLEGGAREAVSHETGTACEDAICGDALVSHEPAGPSIRLGAVLASPGGGPIGDGRAVGKDEELIDPIDPTLA